MKRLLNKEDREEHDTLDESGKNDGQGQDVTGGTGVAACGFGGFGAEDTDAEAGTEGSGQEQRIKRRMAREKGFKLGDDGIEYIVLQVIETFEHSAHVDEIYGTDRELRREISQVIKKYTQDRSEELDREVRGKIKNLQEGSSAFDVEYERVLAEIRRRKGLDAD